MLNCGKCNNNYVLKESLLACKNFDFLETDQSYCTMDATDFTSMASWHNSFSVVSEINSSAPCKIAARVGVVG
jgi:hypothetical protein